MNFPLKKELWLQGQREFSAYILLNVRRWQLLFLTWKGNVWFLKAPKFSKNSFATRHYHCAIYMNAMSCWIPPIWQNPYRIPLWQVTFPMCGQIQFWSKVQATHTESNQQEKEPTPDATLMLDVLLVVVAAAAVVSCLPSIVRPVWLLHVDFHALASALYALARCLPLWSPTPPPGTPQRSCPSTLTLKKQ